MHWNRLNWRSRPFLKKNDLFDVEYIKYNVGMDTPHLKEWADGGIGTCATIHE